MRRWFLCQVSSLSLPGAAAPQFWGEGGLSSQHFPLTLSKPLTRTEAVRQAQAGAVPPCWPLVTLHKACLCFCSGPWGECVGGGGVSCKSNLSPVPQGPHAAQPGTCASCPQRDCSPKGRAECPRLAGSRQHLWKRVPLHCKLFSHKAPSLMAPIQA